MTHVSELKVDINSAPFDTYVDHDSDYDADSDTSETDYPVHYCTDNATLVLIRNCFEDIIAHDSKNIKNILEFKRSTLTLWSTATYYCTCPDCNKPHDSSLAIMMATSDKMTPQAYDFALGHNIVSVDDMKFLDVYTQNINNEAKWPTIYHLVKHIYSPSEVVAWRDDDGNSLPVRLLRHNYCFNEKWFMSILEVMKSYQFDMTDKVKNMYSKTFLDLVIDKLSAKSVRLLVQYGCKFVDGGLYPYELADKKVFCDAVQKEIYEAYSKTTPTEQYEQSVFDTVRTCVECGYDPKSEDSEGKTLVDYVQTLVPKDTEFYKLYSELFKYYLDIIS